MESVLIGLTWVSTMVNLDRVWIQKIEYKKNTNWGKQRSKHELDLNIKNLRKTQKIKAWTRCKIQRLMLIRKRSRIYVHNSDTMIKAVVYDDTQLSYPIDELWAPMKIGEEEEDSGRKLCVKTVFILCVLSTNYYTRIYKNRYTN